MKSLASSLHTLPIHELESIQFMEDALDLFTGQKQGHMTPYMFSEPKFDGDIVNGGKYWQSFMNTARYYYPAIEEPQLISNSAPEIGRILPAMATCIDLGPGEKKAILSKTLPFVKSLKDPWQYMAVDLNESFAHDGSRLVLERMGIASIGLEADFLERIQGLPQNNAQVITLFGGTLCNFGSSAAPAEGLQKSFQRIRQHLKKDDFFIITQDVNQDAEDIMRAYKHPSLAGHFLNLMHRVERDLPVHNFDPSSFEFRLQWNPLKHLLTFNVSPSRMMNFRLGDYAISLRAGDILPLVNCYKFPENVFIHAAELAGFESIKSYQSFYKRIVLHVLKAS